MVGNGTEHMKMRFVANRKDLPGSRPINQLGAIRYFDAVRTIPIITSATDVEFVAKYTTGMSASCYVKVLAWAPFISVYAVNLHRGNR